MKFYTMLCLFIVDILVGGTATLRHKSNIVTISNIPKEIIIPVKVHLDFHLSKKIAKEHGFRKRKKIKEIVYSILQETNKIFRRPSLNQTITLKLLDTKFLRKTKNITMDEHATNYLRSYCELQNHQKELEKKHYYSILLTGLNLFYMNNGEKFTKSTGRSYKNGVCNVKKSCALIEWKPRNMAYLLAHEIGHSLGMPHDGPPNNSCINLNGIMNAKYDPSNNPNTWSLCSRLHFEYFLRRIFSLRLPGKQEKCFGLHHTLMKGSCLTFKPMMSCLTQKCMSEKAWCLNKAGSHVHSMYNYNG